MTCCVTVRVLGLVLFVVRFVVFLVFFVFLVFLVFFATLGFLTGLRVVVGILVMYFRARVRISMVIKIKR